VLPTCDAAARLAGLAAQRMDQQHNASMADLAASMFAGKHACRLVWCAARKCLREEGRLWTKTFAARCEITLDGFELRIDAGNGSPSLLQPRADRRVQRWIMRQQSSDQTRHGGACESRARLPQHWL
jgi:hypothetical protein